MGDKPVKAPEDVAPEKGTETQEPEVIPKTEYEKVVKSLEELKKERRKLKEKLKEYEVKLSQLPEYEKLQEEIEELRRIKEEYERVKEEEELKNKSELEKLKYQYEKEKRELERQLKSQLEQVAKAKEELEQKVKEREEKMYRLQQVRRDAEIRACVKGLVYNEDQVVKLLRDEFILNEDGEWVYPIRNKNGTIIEEKSIAERVKEFLNDPANRNLVIAKSKGGTGIPPAGETTPTGTPTRKPTDHDEFMAFQMGIPLDEWMKLAEKIEKIKANVKEKVRP